MRTQTKSCCFPGSPLPGKISFQSLHTRNIFFTGNWLMYLLWQVVCCVCAVGLQPIAFKLYFDFIFPSTLPTTISSMDHEKNMGYQKVKPYPHWITCYQSYDPQLCQEYLLYTTELKTKQERPYKQYQIFVI